MINKQIFENKPLVFIQLPEERILLAWTIEKLKHKLTFDFLDTENGRIIPTAKNVIVDSGIASAYDYFCFYGKNMVKPYLWSRFVDRMSKMSEKEKHKLTNNQIWGFVEKIREEEKYYCSPNKAIPKDIFARIDAENRKRLAKIV